MRRDENGGECPATLGEYRDMCAAIGGPKCRAVKFLDENKILYLDIDIGKDNDAFIFVEKLTRRVRIPTMVFPDGSIMIEPANDELGRKLGIG